ncbi:unnamed protein product [Rhizopus microsporus]|uniref:Biogenesis of lysosome-related organelles complex 1 subunit 7 n=1 Tax=Rhizopus microsporus TaxID=58291 RepID=A0A0A1P8Y4_RHIZD|nr:hypothetical protein BCV71DRAFT_228543 [Rhizopus microsporus]CEJ00529.1 hypothetical protein RMCBS344292_14582 [Rhizopus microsporus]
MAESLPQSIQSLFGPIVLEIDQAITSVQVSQKELSQEMDKLTSDLEQFSGIAEPPKLQSCLDKLMESKKRLNSSSALMQQITERVERIQSKLSKK